MRSELIIKSRSLVGASDLTLLAPIKTGLVASLESVTYKTRIKRLLKTLNGGRASSHEYALLRPFSDAVDRVGKIHSVRVAIVEPDKLLLSVTFDGGQESYLRVLWQKVGTLLDLIFCNTEAYVSAWDHSFEDWAGWVREVQIETDFFYGMPGLTVDDVQYLRNEERLHRQMPGGNAADLLAARQTVQSAEEETWSRVFPTKPHVTKELGRQGLRALAFVYRLSSYYLPATADGGFLHRAARDLLQEFIRLNDRHELDPVIKEGRKRFDEQITWLLTKVEPREIPSLPEERPQPDDANDVQGGILSPYPDDFRHGCLLLVAFRGRAAAAKFLDALTDEVAREAAPPGSGKPAVNIAFTCEGLRALGLSETQLGLFPQEFREGMEARASLLGDLRTNHPLRWRLPLRNCKPPASAPATEPPLAVALSSVHVVVQLRMADGPASVGETLDERDPLFKLVTNLRDAHRDVEFLAVQPMLRHLNSEGKPREHFGFADGQGQPVLDPGENGKIYNRNQVQLGEFLLGYANEAEQAMDPDGARDPDLAREWHSLLHNGSFLVVRKLYQDVKALEDAVSPEVTKLDKELVLAKMMGRWRNGNALAAGGDPGNDFDYAEETPPGSLCPFHAHIRRANPRQLENPDLMPPPGRRTPRLMRRGMSYGPAYDPQKPESWREPRGMVFMAYNASIAEQFEVVQRWISGGNSSGGYSGQSDPLLGVAPNGERRFYRFEHENKVYQIALDGSEFPLGDPQPFVRLEWGAYLFTPSIKALRKMARIGREQAAVPEAPAWSVSEGWRRIQDLFALEREQGAEKAGDAWKALLEDPEAQRNFDSAGVWAAIRRLCGGVLRTPYGVIVADRELVQQVLAHSDGLYSVSGYHERMTQSIGEIYLGLDDHGEACRYREQSAAVNKEIGKLGQEATFMYARDAAKRAIDALVANEKALAGEFGESRWELNLDVKEIVDSALAALCQQWFGLPADKCEIQAGGARWDWKQGDPPFYPGHFTAPSRYIFQPQPGKSAEEFGKRYGQALRQAFGKLIKRHRDDPGAAPVLNDQAPLTKPILEAFPRSDKQDPASDDLAARTMVGAMMGFLPTVDGNLRLSLNEWLRDGSFWSLRTALKDRNPATPFRNAQDLLEQRLKQAMQLRPSPELIWRSATRHDRIGGVAIRPGDKIVVAIVSATQQSLEEGSLGVCPVFGGDRRQSPHPTHACPGYEAAMGALLGILSALLEIGESMRPSVALLALTLEGDQPTVARADKRGLVAAPHMPVITRFKRDPRMFNLLGGLGELEYFAGAKGVGNGHTLVADGDSWFSYSTYGPFSPPQNIADYLETKHGFKVVNLASPSTRLFDFYDDDRGKLPLTCDKPRADSFRLNRLVAKLKRMAGKPPTAILLSAAGNDVVEERLLPLLNKKAAGQPPLKEPAVAATVDGLMQCWLERILDRITAECERAFGAPVPVFIHGYDFPVPDCRYVAGVVSERNAWLYPSLKEMKYLTQTWNAYPTEGVPIMRDLIVRLNTMQARVAGLPRFKNHVFHVKLSENLSNLPADYEDHWENELHPSETGFTLLAQKFADALAANIQVLKVQP